VAAFSSGITIAFTLALVIMNITVALQTLVPLKPFISCAGFTTVELGLASTVGICYDLGQNPNMIYSVLDFFAPNGTP
jgi:hypothetical protein